MAMVAATSVTPRASSNMSSSSLGPDAGGDGGSRKVSASADGRHRPPTFHDTTQLQCAINWRSWPLAYLASVWRVLELGVRAPSQGYSQIDTRGNSWAGPRT